MQKRQYTAEYKAKIVLEILREEHTVSEIGAREEVSAKQLHNWKKEFLDNAAKAFSSSKAEKAAKKEVEQRQEEKEALEKKVGQLAVENDFLKKKYREIHGVDWNGFQR